MPGRIIALYVLLWIRVLSNAVALVKGLSGSGAAAAFLATASTADFGACLFLLIALYQRKSWTILAYRIYVAIALPVSLFLMGAGAVIAARNGAPMPWNPFIGGVIASIAFAWFAWYVGQPKGQAYFPNMESVESPAPPFLQPEPPLNLSEPSSESRSL